MRVPRVSWWFAVASVLAVAGASAGVEPAFAAPPTKQKDPKDQARELAKEGIKVYDANDPSKALELFTQAEGLFHAPTHTLHIARAQAKLGKLVEAKATYEKLAAEDLGPKPIDIFAKAKESGKTELASLEARIPKLGIEVGPVEAKDVSVTLDGVELPAEKTKGTLEVNPGTYTLVARGVINGQNLETRPEVVEAKEGAVLAVTLRIPRPVMKAPPPPPKASPLKGIGVASLVMGGAGLVAGAILGGLSFPTRDDATELFDECEADLGKGHCAGARADEVTSTDDKATAFGNAGIGFLIGGAAFTGVGVALIVVGGKKPKDEVEPDAATVVPILGPTYAGLRGSF